MAEDDTCQGLLTIGKCAEDEEVLMDPNTRKVGQGGFYRYGKEVLMHPNIRKVWQGSSLDSCQFAYVDFETDISLLYIF